MQIYHKYFRAMIVASLCVCVEFILAIFLTQLNFADQLNLTSNFEKSFTLLLLFGKSQKSCWKLDADSCGELNIPTSLVTFNLKSSKRKGMKKKQRRYKGFIRPHPQEYYECTAGKILQPQIRSKIFTWVIFSLLAFGLSGASVSRTGCSSGATRSSL